MNSKSSKPFLIVFEPEIAGNMGSLIRLSACFETRLAIIEPMAFIFDPHRLKRSAMDYFDKVEVEFFDSIEDFRKQHKGRIIGTSSKANHNYTEFSFQAEDAIMLGKESTGIPEKIMATLDQTIKIPIKARSLNLAISGSIILSHALWKTGNI